jgi:transcriptional regulator with XRE-family HTH domain
MYHLHSSQIKAARAMLGWSQEQMAQESGLAITTIRNMEMGYVPRGRTADIIRQAIEKAGVEFTEDEGIRRRKDTDVYRGAAGADLLIEDMRQTISAKGGEIITMMPSQQMLAHSCGAIGPHATDQLTRLGKFATVKCLLPHDAEVALNVPQFQFRTIADKSFSPMPFYVYGNKFVHVLDDDSVFRFIVVASINTACTYRAQFLALWAEAMPLTARSA